MGATSSKEGPVPDDGFVTVTQALSPEEEKQESAEVAILRKVKQLKVSRPILSWKKKDLADLEKYISSSPLRRGSHPGNESETESTSSRGHTNFVAALEESSGGEKVQRTLESAFTALAKWYARQATLVTRQQLALHEEIEEVSYMAKLAVQGVTKKRDALKTSLRDIQGIHIVQQEVDSLKAQVKQALVVQERLNQALDAIEESKKS